MIKNYPEVFAYKSIEKDFSKEADNLSKGLDALIEISKKVESSFVRELKPYIALTLKWKFDYLIKTQEFPFLLQRDVDYWIDFLKASKDLLGQNWFFAEKYTQEKDPWKRTRKAFDFMWPKNTKKEQYDISLKMIELRTDQIVAMMPEGGRWLKDKAILDSGCGPGRYISALLKHKPAKAVGIDTGGAIIKENKERFKRFPHVQFSTGTAIDMPFKDESFDLVVSAGVLHHIPHPIEKSIREHARVLAKGGYFFMFIAGKGGLELKMWEFVRNFLYDVPIEDVFHRFNGKISPLRLQGLLDHSYGEYQQTSRVDCEKWLRKYFSEIKRVPGIEGLDVTPEIYANDLYFQYRFGTGNLRYLCKK